MKFSENQPDNETNGHKDLLNDFEDIEYICDSHEIITKALQSGCDITWMPDGELIVTEVKTVSTGYRWNQKNKKWSKYVINM